MDLLEPEGGGGGWGGGEGEGLWRPPTCNSKKIEAVTMNNVTWSENSVMIAERRPSLSQGTQAQAGKNIRICMGIYF